MRRIKWERIIAVLVVLPSILAIAVFVYGFIGFTGFASLTKWNNLLPDFTLVGFSNYQKLFANQRFQIDIRNTVSFTILFLFLCLVLGFLLAFLLDQRIRAAFLTGGFGDLNIFDRVQHELIERKIPQRHCQQHHDDAVQFLAGEAGD